VSRPRIRCIKPEFWDSESIGSLPRDARLLYVGLWSMADDEGRIRASARRVRKVVFGFDDDVTHAQVDEWLGLLEEAGKLIRYESEGHALIAILGWSRHQKINRPVPSSLPPPSNSVSPHGDLSEASVSPHGDLSPPARAGSDRIGSEYPPTRASARDNLKFVKRFIGEYAKHHGGLEYVWSDERDSPAVDQLLGRYPPAKIWPAILRLWAGENDHWTKVSTTLAGVSSVIQEAMNSPPAKTKGKRGQNGKADWRRPYTDRDDRSKWEVGNA